MLRKYYPFVLLSLGLLLQTSPIPLRAVALGLGGLAQIPMPAGSVPVNPALQADLDGNGTPETLALTGGRLSILSEGGTLTGWQSPLAWQVLQAMFSDLNRDGQPEVTLLVWRPFRPWPVDQWLPNGRRIDEFHNAEGQSCHIILIGWIRGGYHELWAGSAMADPITVFAAADLNGDKAQELLALEGRYTDPDLPPEHARGGKQSRTLKVWEWNGFGFTVVSSMDGTFSNITVVQANKGPILILVP